MSWRCSRYFWIRTAGFPCSWLDGLALPKAQGAPGDPALSPRDFTGDVTVRRQLLLEYTSDPLVLEALYLSNREAQKRIQALGARPASDAPNARTRQHFRLAWSYLQRFCSKNDTASFFGPIAWGEFSPSAPRAELRAGQGGWLRSRRVFFEHWAVQRIADAMSDDPEIAPFLPLRVNPGCYIEGDRLHYPLDRSIAVPWAAGEALRRIEASGGRARTAGTIAAELAAETGSTPEAAAALLSTLLAKRVLSRRILVPTAVTHPEASLEETLSTLPDACPGRERWRAFVAELFALRAAFERAGLEERIRIDEELQRSVMRQCGTSLSRETGTMYVGRYVLYEDCQRNLDLTLPDGFREDLEAALCPVLDAFHAMAAAVSAKLEERYLAVYRALARPGEVGVDFLRFYHHARERADVAEIVAELRAKLRDVWSSVLPTAGAAEEIALSPAQLRELSRRVAAWSAGSPPPILCDVHSPDILIAATGIEDIREGRYRIILGEIHPGVHTVSQLVAQPFCPFAAELGEEVQALLSPTTLTLVDPPERYQRSHINWLDCEALVEVVTPGCASRLAPERQIPAGRGRVVADRGRLRFLDPVSGRSGDLLTLMPNAFHGATFQLAREVLGGGYPGRIVCGRVVLKRRTWLVTPEALPSVERPGEEAMSFAALRRWAEDRGMPRWVFVAAQGEPKPVFVDFASPMAVDLFYKLARQAPQAVISEMRPSPEELWLRDERGAYTCELRTTFCRAQQRASSTGAA